MNVCHKRLQKEYLSLKQQPVDNIEAVPNDRNILEWHYVVFGPKDTVYEGGVYHGKLLFSEDYPYKPPAIIMITSMSDFHPETWNPLWSVGSILSGLLSFMLETKPTLGSIETSSKKKRELAKKSMEENIRSEQFRRFFPELVAEYKKKKEEGGTPEAQPSTASVPPAAANSTVKAEDSTQEQHQVEASSAISCRTVAAALVILVIAILLPFKL